MNELCMSTLSRKQNIFKLSCYLLLLLVTITSCEEKQRDITYLGGKVVNPRAGFVIIHNYSDFRDTLELDEQQRFSFVNNNFKTGWYTFHHGDEYQSVYIKKGDSLKWRFNSKSFDESLAFTGSRAKENNYLINLYIELEQLNDQITARYNQQPKDFKKYIDSIIKAQKKRLLKVAKVQEFDPKFVADAEKLIEWNGWSRLERYPYTHFGKTDFLQAKGLPSNFFSHRNSTNINDIDNQNMYTFPSYVRSLVSNLSLYQCSLDKGNGADVHLGSLDYRKKKLKVIDSIFTVDELKDIYASAEVRNYIRSHKGDETVQSMIDVFTEISSNDELVAQINGLASTYINLSPGNEIPNFELYNTEKNEVKINEVIDRMSVLFFWSYEDEDYAIRIHNQIRDLRTKYPEIKFIGINIDNPNSDLWNKANKRLAFNPKHEYQIRDPKTINSQLALSKKNRSMVVSSRGIIMDPNINLFHYKIETTLLGYLSR
ncbi:hypothetical protein [Nonlabens tegetincola]|uniref:hypothetical protein n=1 Tax=Nonlabens tegetincola TaxID=323273 RepID=UPI0030C8CD1E